MLVNSISLISSTLTSGASRIACTTVRQSPCCAKRCTAKVLARQSFHISQPEVRCNSGGRALYRNCCCIHANACRDRHHRCCHDEQASTASSTGCTTLHGPVAASKLNAAPRVRQTRTVALSPTARHSFDIRQGAIE